MKKRKRQTDRIWQAGLVFALLLLLCGCTRKEDLLLLSEETEGTAQDMSAFSQDAGEETTAADGAGQAAFAGETGRVPEGSRQVPDGENRGMEAAQGSAPATKPGVIYVHVCGAVEKPGVYELEAGSRVYETVLEPGKVQDSAGIELGIVGGASPDGRSAGTETSTGASANGRININTATAAQLCEIPGVGATRAATIVSYRETHGAFEKPEDIMKVSGIKEGMYEKIKDSISVN